jgi:long-subunit fatty acid transport protein
MLYWINQVSLDKEVIMYAMPDEKTNPDEMLSANQAGRIPGVSGKTIIRMMEDGEFPGYKIGVVWKFRRGI